MDYLDAVFWNRNVVEELKLIFKQNIIRLQKNIACIKNCLWWKYDYIQIPELLSDKQWEKHYNCSIIWSIHILTWNTIRNNSFWSFFAVSTFSVNSSISSCLLSISICVILKASDSSSELFALRCSYEQKLFFWATTILNFYGIFHSSSYTLLNSFIFSHNIIKKLHLIFFHVVLKLFLKKGVYFIILKHC